jgi:ribose 5-phosphate isomerase B
MKVAIGSDHAGFRYKGLIIDMLRGMGHQVDDFGTNSTDPVDYPLFIRPVAEAVANGDYDRGVVLGGSGNGEAIVAIRCTICWCVDAARFARMHNDANVLSIGERLTPEASLREIVETWFTTAFEGGRHIQRIQEIDA